MIDFGGQVQLGHLAQRDARGCILDSVHERISTLLFVIARPAWLIRAGIGGHGQRTHGQVDEKLGIAGCHVGGHLQAEPGALFVPGRAQHPGLVAQHAADTFDLASGHHAFEQNRHHLVQAPGHLALQAAAGFGSAGAADGCEGWTHDFLAGLQVPVLEAGTGQ